MPSSTTRAKAPKRRLLARKAPSLRHRRVDRRPASAAGRPARRAVRSPSPATIPKKASRAGPIPVLLNEWTDSSTPERVRKVARMVRLKVAMTSERFQTRSMPRRSWTITECRKAVRRQPRKEGGVLHRVPRPVAAPAEHLVAPPRPEDHADGQEAPGEEGPAPGLDEPALADPAGDKAGAGEGEGNGEADQPQVEQAAGGRPPGCGFAGADRDRGRRSAWPRGRW